MKNVNILKRLIRSNLKKSASLDLVVRQFVRKTALSGARQLNSFMAGLQAELPGLLEQPHGERMALSRLGGLKFSIETDGLDIIYSRTAEDVPEGRVQKADPAIGFVFDEIDLEAIDAMTRSFQWMADDASDMLQKELKGVVEALFNGEIARAELADELQQRFDRISKKGKTYFQGVADQIVNQGQNMARVIQGSKYGVEFYQVIARIDDRTSDICRSMHRRVIPAGHIQKQTQAIIRARSIEEKKNAAAWSSEPVFGKLPKNLGLPPYHFHCRTLIRPVWPENQAIDGGAEPYTVKNTVIPALPLVSHIDRTGAERIFDPEKLGVPGAEIVQGLDAITAIGPSAIHPEQTVARTQNGLLLTFNGDELLTVEKPKDVNAEFKARTIAMQVKTFRKFYLPNLGRSGGLFFKF